MELENDESFKSLINTYNLYVSLIQEIKKQFVILETQTSTRTDFKIKKSTKVSDSYAFIIDGVEKVTGVISYKETLDYMEKNNYGINLISKAILEIIEEYTKNELINSVN